MRKDSLSSTKNVFILVITFTTIIGLLYGIAISLHKEKKIQAEKEAIIQANEKDTEKITSAKKQIEYLKTPQRFDKEAKMQLSKKQPNEKVLIFIDETKTHTIIPNKQKPKITPQTTIWEKWKWIFFER